jgi:hypothetical protein
MHIPEKENVSVSEAVNYGTNSIQFTKHKHIANCSYLLYLPATLIYTKHMNVFYRIQCLPFISVKEALLAMPSRVDWLAEAGGKPATSHPGFKRRQFLLNIMSVFLRSTSLLNHLQRHFNSGKHQNGRVTAHITSQPNKT